MKRSRFSGEQIVAILRQQEAAVPTAEAYRRHGISSATFYKWKAKLSWDVLGRQKNGRAVACPASRFPWGGTS
jgi:hypothetical protein